MTPVALPTQTAEANYDAIAQTYDDRYRGPFWDLYNHVTLDRAGAVLPATGHILDAGAGTGKFALHWLARGHEVTLLDPSPKMLEVARHRLRSRFPEKDAEFQVGTIEECPFPDGRFDGVFCEGDPLSYCVTTHAKAARELLRVLKPGGAFYVSCDNRWDATLILAASDRMADAFAAARDGVSRDPYGVPVHAFDPDELRDLFLDAGAADVQVTGKVNLTHLLPPAVLASLAKDEARFREWCSLEAALARKPALAGFATHLTVTGRKA